MNKLNIIKKRIKTFSGYIHAVVRMINRDKIYNRSAELAYYLVMAILTMTVTIVYAAHFMPNIIQTVDERILIFFPDEIKDLVINALLEVKVPKSYTIIFFTFCTSIWFVSRVMHSLMVSFGIIYSIDKTRKIIKAKIFAIIFTLSLVALFLLMFYLSVLGGALSNLLQNFFNFTEIETQRSFFINEVMPVLSMLLIFTLLYYYLPNKKVKFLNVLPGAFFAALTWFFMAKGFSYYVNNINAFSWILGSLGSLFVFLIWIYYCSIFILLGAEINVHIQGRINKQNKS